MLPAVLLSLVLGAGSAAAPPQERDSSTAEARRIVDHVDRLLRGNSSRAVVEMAVVTRDWQRLTRMTISSAGTENVLIRVQLPRKDEGTATLRTGGSIWNYLPNVDRVIRVPTSMMMAAWMGSHFTNDDLVKESRLVRDYDIRTAFEGMRAGTELYEFLLTPKPAAPVVWGHITYVVRKADLMPVSAQFFGDDGVLKRTLVFSEYARMGGRLVPCRLRMTPRDEPGSYTELHYLALAFDVPMPARSFSLSALRGTNSP